MMPDTTRLHVSISAVFSIGLLSVHLYTFLLQGRNSVFWFNKNAWTRTDWYTCIHILASMWPQAITESARSESSAMRAHSFIFPLHSHPVYSHVPLSGFLSVCIHVSGSRCTENILIRSAQTLKVRPPPPLCLAFSVIGDPKPLETFLSR